MVASSGWAGGYPVPSADARQWLLRVHHAAAQHNYQGTLVVMAGGAMSSSRMTHYCEGGRSLERVDVLDGQPRQVLRQNDRLLTLWPSVKLARLEQRDGLPPFPSLLAGREEQVFERYEMIDEGQGRVAGWDASVFLLKPRDGARFAQRLWAERKSGLLLRADVIGGDGRVLETSAFSQVAIGEVMKPPTVEATLQQLEGGQVQRPQAQQTSLDAEGWRLRAPVAGFDQTSCVRRQLRPMPGHPDEPAAQVVQAVFTDGLTQVSLFIEPFQPERHHAGSAAMGATHSLMRQHGDYWVTVIGDVPISTLKAFAAALERGPAR
jgi:sigma-E factor negative regulatory protein RseB